jgi:hypothetical protein
MNMSFVLMIILISLFRRCWLATQE